MSTYDFFAATSLTGGGVGALDKISGASLADKDAGLVMHHDNSQFLPYSVDASSGAAENSPYVIAPDSPTADERWILQGISCPTLKRLSVHRSLIP